MAEAAANLVGGIEEEAAGDDDPFDGEDVEVEEHLKDAVEGSLRLKRLLSRDQEDASGKRRKVISPKEAKITKLLAKWFLSQDGVSWHVLEQCTDEEINALMNSGYMPDRSNVWKSPGELLAKHLSGMREGKSPNGYGTDHVAAAKFRWKLNVVQERQLRTLSHKDLRYVLDNYDGKGPLDEYIVQATATPAEEGTIITENAAPDAPGIASLGRFSRLELIDPLADAAVFGDANLTFSLRLAKHRCGLGHVGRVIATTFENLPTLRQRYKEIDESIKILIDHNSEVLHCVDCTRIALDPQFKGMESSLGAVYYNFPHSGAIQGFFDGHPLVNWRHENLMRLFFRALRSFVKPGGIVKVSSNAGAVGVRYYYIINSAVENEFEHTETVPFLQWHLHRYGRSYGDKRDIYKRPDAKQNESYNAQAADRDMVYCFRYKPTGKTLEKQMVRLPPTLTTIMSCNDGPLAGLMGPARQNFAENLHKRFVTEISGTHVG
eukprot:TRINITY_DN5707_c0_g1_i4.p1 TRINITY_DN5707_c0_g1~~TRINITY_DN5707_c0_g1_i4.p1  ORF type:complete len:567 (-),score=107.74 TRINITY_DN5707_c0_g1_i4:65-1540(-)